MASEAQVQLLSQGVEVWNNWREQHPDESIDLTDAKFRDVDLARCNLSAADLSGADFSSSNLDSAIFRKAICMRRDSARPNWSTRILPTLNW